MPGPVALGAERHRACRHPARRDGGHGEIGLSARAAQRIGDRRSAVNSPDRRRTTDLQVAGIERRGEAVAGEGGIDRDAAAERHGGEARPGAKIGNGAVELARDVARSKREAALDPRAVGQGGEPGDADPAARFEPARGRHCRVDPIGAEMRLDRSLGRNDGGERDTRCQLVDVQRARAQHRRCDVDRAGERSRRSGDATRHGHRPGEPRIERCEPRHGEAEIRAEGAIALALSFCRKLQCRRRRRDLRGRDRAVAAAFDRAGKRDALAEQRIELRDRAARGGDSAGKRRDRRAIRRRAEIRRQIERARQRAAVEGCQFRHREVECSDGAIRRRRHARRERSAVSADDETLRGDLAFRRIDACRDLPADHGAELRRQHGAVNA